MRTKARKGKGRRRGEASLQCINPTAAGIDCGATAHYVAVSPDADPKPIRSFTTYTADLQRLADWLKDCGVTTVAMEATGVYWIPIYEILEERGIEVLLVNAHHVKNVSGRKSDVADCEWLRQLHRVGLLRGSFRPTEEIVALRGLLRHRETLVQSCSTAIMRMQKALIQMNLQLHVVLSDIVGATGLAILRDIVGGLTDPVRLASHRDSRCKASETEIVAALTGHYRSEHVFALRQNLELYDALQNLILSCDGEIERQLNALAEITAPPPEALPTFAKRRPRKNEPHFDARTLVHRITHVDLSRLDGIGPFAGLSLVSEIGTDMSHWPTPKHFTSWLTVAPNNRVSGGRLLGSRTRPSANRAAVILRTCAASLIRTQTALGAFYRRLAPRIGKAKALTALARKLAILVYLTLKGTITYQDPGVSAYERNHREAAINSLRRRARSLGFQLLHDPTTAPQVGVS
jgi:transposase